MQHGDLADGGGEEGGKDYAGSLIVLILGTVL